MRSRGHHERPHRAPLVYLILDRQAGYTRGIPVAYHSLETEIYHHREGGSNDNTQEVSE